jgi:hypothetical protein
MKNLILLLLLGSISCLGTAQATESRDVVISCHGHSNSYSLVITRESDSRLLLEESGYSGNKSFYVTQNGDTFRGTPYPDNTMYDIEFSRKADGGYRVILTGGFGGGFDFASDECSTRP